MYQSILDSDFFDLFIDGLIGNTRVNELEESGNSYGFWIMRNLARKYLKYMEPLLSNDITLFDNVTELAEIKSYSKENIFTTRY